MDVHLGFAYLSLSKLTVCIAQYGLQTTEFWLSRHFGITGNISKQPEGPVKKAFLVISWVFNCCFLLHHIRSVGSCRAVSLGILALLQRAPAPSLHLHGENSRQGENPRQGEVPSGWSWLHMKIFHGLKSCSHSRLVQMWGREPQSGPANHGPEKSSSF